MAEVTGGMSARVREVLHGIGDPCSVASGTPMSIEEMGLVKDVAMDDNGCLHITLRLTAPLCHNVGYFDVEIKRLLASLPGVSAVAVTMDHGLEWTPDHIRPAAAERRRQTLELRGIVPR